MAVGLTGLPELWPVAGIRLGTACAGIKVRDRRDLCIIEAAPGTVAAATFTKNTFCAAPVIIAKRHLATGFPRFLLINTGFANAGTGTKGIEDALACCDALAHQAQCRRDEVLPFSTGVIGEPLPVERIRQGLAPALAACREDGWSEAARGIMTTDTVPKGASRRVQIGAHPVTITGIAKGAGMISPNMATMLAFVATDARIAPALLQRCLGEVVEQSFNRITIDGDTSTNDACVLLATGQGAAPSIEHEQDPGYRVFFDALRSVCAELAQAIVRDGEGATKFITVHVQGGRDGHECWQVAQTVANSPLVKTAFFASDPNWGRILAAVGRAGIMDLSIDRVAIHLDDTCIVRNGARAPDYQEAAGQRVMKQSEITIRIDLGRGAAEDRVWTCDFSYEYVKINAEYRS